MITKAFQDYTIWFVVVVIAALIGAAVIASLPAFADFGFDKSTYFDGLIAFTTGASIAVFLALIHSNETHIRRLRQYPRASWNVYATVFLNTFLIVVLGGFVANDTTKLFIGVGVDNFVTILATGLTLQILYRIKTLLGLYLKP
jgi:hypothetical protein